MRRIISGIFALSVFTATTSSAQDLGLPIGSRPAVAGVMVDGLDGKPVSLERYVGRGPVLLEFWATWCPNCKQLEPRMAAARAQFGTQVRFVGIAVGVNQSPARVKAYAAKHKLPLEVLYDRTGAAAEAFDVPATSYVVVLDASGKIVYSGAGGDQDIASAVRRALPAASPAPAKPARATRPARAG